MLSELLVVNMTSRCADDGPRHASCDTTRWSEPVRMLPIAVFIAIAGLGLVPLLAAVAV